MPPPRWRLLKWIAPRVFGGFISLLALLTWLFNANNPATPAGYVGYLTRDAWFGKAKFIGTQMGPTSYGKSWLMQVINVSVTPTKLTEAFGQGSEVLSKDQLKLMFAVHVLFRVKPEAVKELVDKYSTLKEKGDLTEVAFENFMREPLRTAARQEVEGFAAMEVAQNLTALSGTLTSWARSYTVNTPFEILSVVVGNVQFPAVVSDAVEGKLKAEQGIQTLRFELQQEKLKADKRVAEAQGMARATQIIQQRLTPLYIQHEAIQAQEKMANGTNHSVVYIPVGRNGVPLVSVAEGGVK